MSFSQSVLKSVLSVDSSESAKMPWSDWRSPVAQFFLNQLEARLIYPLSSLPRSHTFLTFTFTFSLHGRLLERVSSPPHALDPYPLSTFTLRYPDLGRIFSGLVSFSRSDIILTVTFHARYCPVSWKPFFLVIVFDR